MIVEFEPDTGKVVHEWHLADYFHPQTNPADSNICPLAPAFAVPVFMYTSFGDVKDSQFGTQYYELQRTLHCWVASFSRQFAPGGEAEYYFKIAAKDQHELFIEQGTRAVSIGGIH